MILYAYIHNSILLRLSLHNGRERDRELKWITPMSTWVGGLGDGSVGLVQNSLKIRSEFPHFPNFLSYNDKTNIIANFRNLDALYSLEITWLPHVEFDPHVINPYIQFPHWKTCNNILLGLRFSFWNLLCWFLIDYEIPKGHPLGGSRIKW